MKKAVIAVALSVLAALLSANVNTVAHAQGNLVAPSNVTAQHTGNPGEVRISWGAVPNAAYYRIGWVAYSDVEPIIASGGDWLEHFAFIDIENRGQIEHTVARLTPGVVYAFIMASNDGRYGTPRWPSSAGWAFLRLNEAPATHASLGSTAINLTWDPVPGAAYYRIGWVVYEDVAPIIAAGGDWLEHFAFIDIQNRGQTARAIGRLTPGLRYAFIVAGNDGRYGTPQWPPASAWQFMTPSVVQPTGPDSDRAALIALYDATDGPNWPNRTNWLSDEPLEHWYGVTTDDDGRVTQLLLRENNLNGPIPAAVGNLTGLVRLDFQGNQLSGTIPSSLSNLAGLEILLLYGNRFTGTIPSSLGNLSDLVALNLSSNDLTGVIPPELGRLTKLTYLSLRSNGLTGPIPSELGDMSSLRSLYLYDNQLDGPIPPNLKNLSNLEGLLLHDNQLSRPVPAWLGNLSRLRSLNLRINGFTGGIPPELGRLSNLIYLNLRSNDLTGPVPTELGNLSNLEQLYLYENQLSGEIPAELGRLSNLIYLNLRSNDLTGPVPTELGNLSNLEQLYLYENQLSGEIPDSLGRLVNLTRLSLRDNQLTGEIPAELGNLVNLQLIRLAGNQLTGCVPTGLQNVADNDLDLLELPNCSEETIVTGFGMDIFDKAIPGLMTKWNIPGGAVALSRNGKLLLAKGYGYADIENREQVQPDSLFRIASLSKPITAVAVLKLVEDGHLNLDDRVFDILDQFEPPGGTIADPRIREVTVRQLLQHSGGWDRERSFDPMFRLGQIERELGVAKPVSCADVIRFMLIRPLDFDPGTDYRYSNFGYCILGRVIEAKTGHSYEAYVKNAVLNPVGITGMRIGGALLNERSEGEVRYYGYTGQSLADSVIPGTPQRVPWEYGGFSLQTMDSNGGWLASTMDLLRFVTALDESREPLILRSETVDTMTARPDIDRWRDSPWHYAMGWLVRPVNDDANWWHTGSLPGTRTLLVRIYPGMAWAVLFNSSPHDSEQMARELNELMWKVTSETSQWPSHDLFPRYGYE